jgi:hypothetical protein
MAGTGIQGGGAAERAAAAVAAVDAGVDELGGVRWDGVAEAELLEALRRVETARRRLEAVDTGAGS